MSYTCANCHQHKDGKPIKKQTEIRLIGEAVQEIDYRGLVRAYFRETESPQTVKEECFCPSCAESVGEPKVVEVIS